MSRRGTMSSSAYCKFFMYQANFCAICMPTPMPAHLSLGTMKRFYVSGRFPFREIEMGKADGDWGGDGDGGKCFTLFPQLKGPRNKAWVASPEPQLKGPGNKAWIVSP